jgi:hypothetical protein
VPLSFDLLLGVDGAVQVPSWQAYLERGEAGLYTAMATDKTKAPGSENDLSVTNLFGSPVLAAAYPDYTCATTGVDSGTAMCPSTVVLDGNGHPLFAPYPGAWSQTAFAKGASLLSIASTNAAAGTAQLSIPNYSNPYDTSSSAAGTLTEIVAFDPNAQLVVPGPSGDKTIATAEVTIAGTTETLRIAYVPKANGSITVQAIEGIRTPGDVFLCRDSATGDLLRARSYTSAQVMLDWIAAHAQAATQCGLVVKTSTAMGTPVISIASRTNGVKVTMGQGDGAGRVVDVLAYDPALGQ